MIDFMGRLATQDVCSFCGENCYQDPQDGCLEVEIE